MKAPVTWLREYCDPGLGAEGIAEALATSGSEVERVVRVGIPSADGNGALYRIGRVMAVEQHPEAHRLKVCNVQLAGADTRTIVCGAPNVAAGEVVLVALPGAVLPDGTKLGQADLRGVRSEGMILSESELQLGLDSDGIMVLADSLEIGEEASRYVQLGDDVIELEVSPNRPDCLSVYGVAREVHAVTAVPLAPDPSEEDAPAEGERPAADLISAAVENPELCPRFSVRVFTDVTIGPSPLWLKARLLAAGQRPINNVVDITNYVMVLLGQPMHAYDLDKVAGPSLVVRLAREGERLTTLDGEERCFDGDAMLICDARGPTGIGGIMGGSVSEVSESTTRVAMEAATWNGPNVLQTSSKLALRTEASARFEKQLDPELALRAQRLTARLMVDLCGARLAPGEIDVAAEPPAQTPIRLRTERVKGLLGVAIDPAESKTILERLGFESEERDGDLDVVPPYFRRQDVTREADVIEEVARIHGLDKIPATLPARERAIGRLTRDQVQRRRVEDLLRDRGLSEVVTYSFIAPDAADRVRLSERAGRQRALHLSNPLSEEMSAMRLMLLPGLLETARRNLAHDLNELRIFETGRVFFSNGPGRLPEERLRLAVLLAGIYQPRTWRSPPIEPDFHVIKGLLQAVLETLQVDWRLAGGGPPFLHPGRAADVLVAGHEAGWVGEVHPLVARNFGLEDLERSPAVFELDLDVVLAAAGTTPTYVDLITYPAVFQDIAVVVDEAVEAQTVIEIVRMGGGRHLRNVTVFDLYRGEQVGEGKKSIALRLEFRAFDRTLTDEDVATQRAEIRDKLAREIGASLRE